MVKGELVFIPTPAIGHLVSHVEFAKGLLDQDERFSVTFLIMDTPFAPELKTYAGSLASSDVPRLRFINLPQTQVAVSVSVSICQGVLGVKLYRVTSCLVVDTFTTPMIEVASELGLSSYLFNTSGVACLGFMLHLITRHDLVGREFQASDTELVIPVYVNPVPNNVSPSVLFDKNGGYICFLNLVRRFKQTKAIISNSFEELESHAVKSLLELEYDIPFYVLGPLLHLHGQSSSLCDQIQLDKIMKWLDDQPPSSVKEEEWFVVGFHKLRPLPTSPSEDLYHTVDGARFWRAYVEMRLDYKLGESDTVTADEIEKAINCVMEADSEVRKKVKKMSKLSREAVSDSNRSSFNSFARLIEFMMSNANKSWETSIYVT
ncbi:Uncharacterized protein TCM_002110 [Theobroma cacao]|uniref:Uncharacterized protein n=1 Tax=Theobroma cacao TaxID=3641 RepID=A0A061DLG7_THECC|nr:Uncharacterized protein TCM_002110 [Theobroma cacao]